MTGKIQNHPFLYIAILIVLSLTACRWTAPGLDLPGLMPGKGQSRITQNELILENNAIACAWSIREGRLRLRRVADKLSGTTLDLKDTECFQLVLSNERILKSSDLKIVGAPRMASLKPNRTACRLAERFGGKQMTVTLHSTDDNLSVRWRGILRDGSNYVRQEVLLAAKDRPIEIEEIVMLDLAAPHAKVAGIVDGSPIVAGNMFFAYEYPLVKSRVLEGSPPRFRCSLPYGTVLEPGEPLMQSSVIGVTPEGQLRRGFLYYLERERVHSYRSFLHYNSWYDIGYGAEKILPDDFLKVAELFGKELIERRRVKMDSFVLDDGWDDPASLWLFHESYPNGFTPLRRTVEKYDSVLGAWLSPFGGYGKAKEERLKYGREQGFEINKSGFSLAGPKYYGRFRDVCAKMLREYGLNYFKFDGIGVGGRPAGTTAEFASDMKALLRLISELRQVRPNVFINTTTGTWASPYWLSYSDSIWRSGRDWGTHGWGSKRQQQITYRDKETYHNVVKRAPLYPLNSLMTQGVMYANHGLPDESDDLIPDIHDFFASGTNCQELYITPSLMRPEHWDALAEATKWSRANVDVLVDTHWIGGDPAEGQIYGWASWNERKGILSLRNPSDKPGRIVMDIGKAFELPQGAARKYSLKSPWEEDAGKATVVLSAGEVHTLELEPFEVLVFDATPH
ncbi:enterotoxin [Planctomycetota bacterium]